MEQTKKVLSLLLVDDQPDVRNMIAIFLRDNLGYKVTTVDNGLDALEKVLPYKKFDLVLSDINMPKMKGFELLHNVHKQYPDIKRVLMTSYNVEDYFDLAMKFNIGNIFVKTVPFNFNELSVVLNNLFTNNIFGPERYMADDSTQHLLLVKDSDDLPAVAQKAVSIISEVKNRKKIELVLIELLSNAVYYGARNETPDKKELWNHHFKLSDEDAVQVKILWDSEKYAISVMDKGGKLKKRDVLYWLNRQIRKDKNGLPVGVMDLHGRGFFIARRYIDRLIINIKENKKTEVIIINYFKNLFNGFKPLYINEI